MVAAVFLSAHKNCITILILFFISISSWFTFSFKKNGILHHIVDSFLLLLKKKEGLTILIHHNLHHFSDAFLLFITSSFWCILFLSFETNRGKWHFLHHLCDSFLWNFASVLWCISSYFNGNTTHLTDSLYLLLHHISDASFSFKVNRAVISSSYWCNFIHWDGMNWSIMGLLSFLMETVGSRKNIKMVICLR